MVKHSYQEVSSDELLYREEVLTDGTFGNIQDWKHPGA